jgi:serine protease Do
MSSWINYQSYEKGGIGAELMNFFLRENAKPLGDGKYTPRTLHDFLDNCPTRHRDQHENLGLIIRTFCHRLIAEGQLFSVGFDTEQDLPYSEQFFSYFFIEELAEYGAYDFTALGFTEVVHRFSPSVIKLNVKPVESSEEFSGTGFLIENNRMVTAAHCVPANSDVSIDNWKSAEHPIKSIKTFGTIDPSRPVLMTRGLIDLAIVEFESDPFPESPKFKLWGAGVLDDCLVMGYPNIAGFDFYQIAGTGQIINEHFSYNRKQIMVFVDVRVKGGNSGGPVINRMGKVIGVITNAESEDEENLGKLGYALATPAQTLLDLVNALDPVEPRFEKELYEISFQPKADNTIWVRN